MNRPARKRHLVGGIALLLLLALVAGCGGSSRLSPSAYRVKLAAIGREANQAQAQVEKGLHAKSVAEIRTRLSTFASAAQKLGDEVAALKPPKNAEASNALLARGFDGPGRQWIFFINVPIGLAALALCPLLLTESRAARTARSYDPAGALTPRACLGRLPLSRLRPPRP